MTLVLPSPVSARRSNRDYLVNTLESARDFRVRTQAAFSLGRMRDPSTRRPLERALARDSNPAVRAAAATALGQLGDRRSRRALRRARRDSSAAVRRQAVAALEVLDGGGRPQQTAPDAAPSRVNWRRVRYAIIVGDVTNRANFGGRQLSQAARRALLNNLRQVRGVVAFPNEAALGAAESEIRRHRVARFRFDAAITSVQQTRRHGETRMRIAVNVMMLADPGRALRGMLQGAASAAEPTSRDSRAQATRLSETTIDAAVRSALSDARAALDDARR